MSNKPWFVSRRVGMVSSSVILDGLTALVDFVNPSNASNSYQYAIATFYLLSRLANWTQERLETLLPLPDTQHHECPVQKIPQLLCKSIMLYRGTKDRCITCRSANETKLINNNKSKKLRMGTKTPLYCSIVPIFPTKRWVRDEQKLLLFEPSTRPTISLWHD
jgi:hypothetical protein